MVSQVSETVTLQNTGQPDAEVSNDDKLISFVAYISTFFLGILAPIFIYFKYKKKSKFVAFHSLQIIYFSIAYGIIIYFPVSTIAKFLGIDFASPFPDKPLLDFFSSYLIFKVLFLGESIAFIIFGYRAYTGLISKLPIVGDMAYSKIFEEPKKASLNLPQKSKHKDTFNDILPPGKGQNSGLI